MPTAFQPRAGAAGRRAGGGLDSRQLAFSCWRRRGRPVGADDRRRSKVAPAARVWHHPAAVVVFAEVATAWLAKGRAVLAKRHCRMGARRAGRAGRSSLLSSPVLPSVATLRGVVAPLVVAPASPPVVDAPAGRPDSQASRAQYPPPLTCPSPAGDGVGWGAVDHLFDVDMVHMPAETSMETAVPVDFHEARADAHCCVNERVVAAVEADDPMGFYRALKWKDMLPQLLLMAEGRGGRRRRHALAWRFRAFAERRMKRPNSCAHHGTTPAPTRSMPDVPATVEQALASATLMGTADTVVALVEDGELSRAASQLSSKGMGDLSDHAIFAQLRDKHPSRGQPIPADAACDIPVDEAAMTVGMRLPYQQLKRGPQGCATSISAACLAGEYAPASGPPTVRAMSEVASMYLQGRLPGWFNRLSASARLLTHVKKQGEGGARDVQHVAVGEAERRPTERAMVDSMNEAYVSVLAPSHLGVGISAGDFVLIHGVHFIAEKLGPRASEDGLQQGAPLATTSFCVAIHPEVQECDSTLEVANGAGRLNADDGNSVGLPGHV
eukprot:jgi/Tetstr1/427491/TSEL_017617.t1